MTNEKSSLAIYIEKISSSSFDALSLDEEQELLEKAVAGDVRARDRIIRANMRFVVSVAKKYARGTAELSDLIQAGNAALFESCFSLNKTA
ncbi:sigma factor, partial [Treponema saccharophilum]|uniref:sigma factor n=1 Tax=Treponema saccharophilum TaxID=165 RepID=UPI00386C5B97